MFVCTRVGRISYFQILIVIFFFCVASYLVFTLKILSSRDRAQDASVNGRSRKRIPLNFLVSDAYTPNQVPERSSHSRSLPVCIVEEHHEVIPYWFGAANLGIVPKRGNILVHMDAHADTVTPSPGYGFPLFYYPGFWQLPFMMQKNDEFIMAAAVTGFLSHMIWVWPSWDKNNPDFMMLGINIGKRMTFNISLGTYRRMDELKQQQQVTYICYCVTALDLYHDLAEYWSQMHCYYRTAVRVPRSIESLLGIEIPPQNCSLKMHAKLDILSEEKMLEEIGPGGWLRDVFRESGSVILDIDEDYFGCEASVAPLYSIGLKEPFIRRLSSRVTRFFCGDTTKHELAADFMFQAIIEAIIASRNVCTTHRIKGHLKAAESNPCVGLVSDMLSSRTFGRPEDMKKLAMKDVSCRPESTKGDSIKMRLFLLLEQLVIMTDRQLRKVAEVGVCFSHSLNTYTGYVTSNMFRLCDGHNRPKSTLVTFFTPGAEDVAKRAKRLEKILQQMAKSIELVTISRSMRDGFTPRSRFHQIEKSILKVLNNVYSEPNALSVHYDADLMGGSQGWPGRWHREISF